MIRFYFFSEKLWHFGMSLVLLQSNKENNGLVAEWLGRALQKLLQRFESARDLKVQTQSFDNQVVAFFVSIKI